MTGNAAAPEASCTNRRRVGVMAIPAPVNSGTRQNYSDNRASGVRYWLPQRRRHWPPQENTAMNKPVTAKDLKSALVIKPLSPALGAELSGVDLREDLPPQTMADIIAAWHEHL